MGLLLITPPDDEPVTAELALAHVRAPSADTEMVAAMAMAARELCEAYTGRAFVRQTWRLTLDAFPSGAIRLPRPGLIEVSEVSYLDADGLRVVMAPEEYEADTSTLPATVAPAYGTSWPAGRAVQIEYVAGYGDDGDAVPAAIKAAILLVTGDLYANREGRFVGVTQTDNPAVRSLLAAHVYREAV
jgi:uncharacterized phiE125 gp8 family phage protein